MKQYQFFLLLAMILIAPHASEIVAQALSAVTLVIAVAALFKEIRS